MTRRSIHALTAVLILAFGAGAASAQFNFPKLPKVKKTAETQPTTATPADTSDAQPARTSSRSQAPSGNPIAYSAVGDTPMVAKDSIVVNAFTLSSYKGSFKTWSWVPRMKFRVNGPIESGSQLYA